MNDLPPIDFFYGQTPMQKFLSKLKPFVPIIPAPKLPELSSVSSYDIFVSPNFMKAWEEAIRTLYIPLHQYKY